MPSNPNAGNEYKPLSNALELYYPNTDTGKKMAAVASSLTSRIKLQPYGKEGFTPTIWDMLLKKIDKSPHELFDRRSDAYKQHIRDKDFDHHDWLNILMKHWSALEAAILVHRKQAWICRGPYEISNLVHDLPIDDKPVW